MAENNQNETPENDIVDEETVQPTRLQTFVTNHPRAAKLIAITGGVTAVLGTGIVTATVMKNKQHVILAGDHAKDALSELSTSVSPTTADTEA